MHINTITYICNLEMRNMSNVLLQRLEQQLRTKFITIYVAFS